MHFTENMFEQAVLDLLEKELRDNLVHLNKKLPLEAIGYAI